MFKSESIKMRSNKSSYTGELTRTGSTAKVISAFKKISITGSKNSRDEKIQYRLPGERPKPKPAPITNSSLILNSITMNSKTTLSSIVPNMKSNEPKRIILPYNSHDSFGDSDITLDSYDLALPKMKKKFMSKPIPSFPEPKRSNSFSAFSEQSLDGFLDDDLDDFYSNNEPDHLPELINRNNTNKRFNGQKCCFCEEEFEIISSERLIELTCEHICHEICIMEFLLFELDGKNGDQSIFNINTKEFFSIEPFLPQCPTCNEKALPFDQDTFASLLRNFIETLKIKDSGLNSDVDESEQKEQTDLEEAELFIKPKENFEHQEFLVTTPRDNEDIEFKLKDKGIDRNSESNEEEFSSTLYTVVEYERSSGLSDSHTPTSLARRFTLSEYLNKTPLPSSPLPTLLFPRGSRSNKKVHWDKSPNKDMNQVSSPSYQCLSPPSIRINPRVSSFRLSTETPNKRNISYLLEIKSPQEFSGGTPGLQCSDGLLGQGADVVIILPYHGLSANKFKSIRKALFLVLSKLGLNDKLGLIFHGEDKVVKFHKRDWNRWEEVINSFQPKTEKEEPSYETRSKKELFYMTKKGKSLLKFENNRFKELTHTYLIAYKLFKSIPNDDRNPIQSLFIIYDYNIDKTTSFELQQINSKFLSSKTNLNISTHFFGIGIKHLPDLLFSSASKSLSTYYYYINNWDILKDKFSEKLIYEKFTHHDLKIKIISTNNTTKISKVLNKNNIINKSCEEEQIVDLKDQMITIGNLKAGDEKKFILEFNVYQDKLFELLDLTGTTANDISNVDTEIMLFELEISYSEFTKSISLNGISKDKELMELSQLISSEHINPVPEIYTEMIPGPFISLQVPKAKNLDLKSTDLPIWDNHNIKQLLLDHRFLKYYDSNYSVSNNNSNNYAIVFDFTLGGLIEIYSEYKMSYGNNENKQLHQDISTKVIAITDYNTDSFVNIIKSIDSPMLLTKIKFVIIAALNVLVGLLRRENYGHAAQKAHSTANLIYGVLKCVDVDNDKTNENEGIGFLKIMAKQCEYLAQVIRNKDRDDPKSMMLMREGLIRWTMERIINV